MRSPQRGLVINFLPGLLIPAFSTIYKKQENLIYDFF